MLRNQHKHVENPSKLDPLTYYFYASSSLKSLLKPSKAIDLRKIPVLKKIIFDKMDSLRRGKTEITCLSYLISEVNQTLSQIGYR